MNNSDLLKAVSKYKKDKISAQVNFINLFNGRGATNSYCIDAELKIVSPSRSCLKLHYTLLFYFFISNSLCNNKGSSSNFVNNNKIECDTSFFFSKEDKEMIVIVHYNKRTPMLLNNRISTLLKDDRFLFEEYKYLIYDSIKESFNKVVYSTTKRDILDLILSNLAYKNYTF